ncbi:MAG: DUF4317 domain-containing protein [Lachnospiraceae bacterium]|nr:DUF4317 domain-containing protein [Lachnospiraceae bacterium]
MNRSETQEIKRRWKYGDCTFEQMVCACTGMDGDITVSTHRFLTLPDELQKQVLSVVNKSMGTGIDLDVPSGDMEKLLKGLLNDSPDESLAETFASMVNTACRENDDISRHIVLILSDTYDVPERSQNREKTGESDEVFRHVVIVICNVKPSKGGIQVTDDGIRTADIFQMIDSPAAAFIYPSFADRMTNYDLIHCSVKKEADVQMVNSVFEASLEYQPPVKKPRKAAPVPEGPDGEHPVNVVLTDVPFAENGSMEDPSVVRQGNAIDAEASGADIPSLDSGDTNYVPGMSRVEDKPQETARRGDDSGETNVFERTAEPSQTVSLAGMSLPVARLGGERYCLLTLDELNRLRSLLGE